MMITMMQMTIRDIGDAVARDGGEDRVDDDFYGA